MVHTSQKEWLVDKTGIRIVVFTGHVRPGSPCTDIYSPWKTKHQGDVWLRYSVSKDAEGHEACHYDLISQARLAFMLSKIRHT